MIKKYKSFLSEMAEKEARELGVKIMITGSSSSRPDVPLFRKDLEDEVEKKDEQEQQDDDNSLSSSSRSVGKRGGGRGGGRGSRRGGDNRGDYQRGGSNRGSKHHDKYEKEEEVKLDDLEKENAGANDRFGSQRRREETNCAIKIIGIESQCH